MYLKVYGRESSEFPEFQDIRVPPEKARIIIKSVPSFFL